ncbi:hypothetical protein MKQ68_18875 [Chitinophaga horti]|uniref:Helicase C-terminal domain-containing protein n=1 Tax=Chitinophaga horti TaxID=2920382 RepID=A0ABY6J1R8_9BACT|nr:hypothetical protein [Chitinophaga horti]UYQ92154.1 hypothetical protein MKQ68_18875 [Chitinophaga horti]
MDVENLVANAKLVFCTLKEKGYNGTMIVHDQYGQPADDNLEFLARQWGKLATGAAIFCTTVSVQMHWTAISFVQCRFFLNWPTDGSLAGGRLEVKKIGRMSNMELAAVVLEFTGLKDIPACEQAISSLGRKDRL